MSPLLLLLTYTAILAYAVVGGVFLAFSDFIMRALAQTGGIGGIDAMKTINREVFRWVFMTLFLGMAALSLLIVGYSVMFLSGTPAVLFLSAGLVYLLGCFAVTVLFNVPMNEALAGMDLEVAPTRSYWTDTYLPRWTRWNTVRTVACTVSAFLLLLGLVQLVQPGVRPL